MWQLVYFVMVPKIQLDQQPANVIRIRKSEVLLLIVSIALIAAASVFLINFDRQITAYLKNISDSSEVVSILEPKKSDQITADPSSEGAANNEPAPISPQGEVRAPAPVAQAPSPRVVANAPTASSSKPAPRTNSGNPNQPQNPPPQQNQTSAIENLIDRLLCLPLICR